MLAKGVLFLQVNIPAHKSHIAMNTIRNLEFELLEQPPYSPDLAPSDYCLFPQLKRTYILLQRRRNKSCRGMVCRARQNFFLLDIVRI
jgi:transposase